MVRTCRPRKFDRVAITVVIVASVFSQLNAIGNSFVSGDVQFIRDNPTIQSGSVLLTAFTRGYWWVGGARETGTYYRPLVVLLDGWDHLLWGGWASGYHVTNTVLHVLVTSLVYSLARVFLRSRYAAIAAGLLFAVHPIHVHAVAYISARSAVLCTGFYLAAVLSALRYSRARASGSLSSSDLALALACYVGALLSLEAAVTLPVALLGLLLLTPGLFAKRRRPLIVFAMGLVATTVVYFVARRLALGAVLSLKDGLTASLAPVPAALTVAKIYAFHFQKLLVPTDVCYVSPFLPVLRAGDASGLASAGLLAATAGFAFAGSRSFRLERTAVAWVLVTLVPFCGLVRMDHFVKGQYEYLPSVGACILFAALGRRAWVGAGRLRERRAARLAVMGTFCVGLSFYTGLTMFENRYWKDSPTLFARTFESESAMSDTLLAEQVMKPTAASLAAMHLQFAASRSEAGDCPGALPHILRATRLARHKHVRLEARQLEAHCLFVLHDYDAALEAYRPLVDDAPKDTLAPRRVAWLYQRRGNIQDAIVYLQKACERGVAPACVEARRLSGDLPAGP